MRPKRRARRDSVCVIAPEVYPRRLDGRGQVYIVINKEWHAALAAECIQGAGYDFALRGVVCFVPILNDARAAK